MNPNGIPDYQHHCRWWARILRRAAQYNSLQRAINSADSITETRCRARESFRRFVPADLHQITSGAADTEVACSQRNTSPSKRRRCCGNTSGRRKEENTPRENKSLFTFEFILENTRCPAFLGQFSNRLAEALIDSARTAQPQRWSSWMGGVTKFLSFILVVRLCPTYRRQRVNWKATWCWYGLNLGDYFSKLIGTVAVTLTSHMRPNVVVL